MNTTIFAASLLITTGQAIRLTTRVESSCAPGYEYSYWFRSCGSICDWDQEWNEYRGCVDPESNKKQECGPEDYWNDISMKCENYDDYMNIVNHTPDCGDNAYWNANAQQCNSIDCGYDEKWNDNTLQCDKAECGYNAYWNQYTKECISYYTGSFAQQDAKKAKSGKAKAKAAKAKAAAKAL